MVKVLCSDCGEVVKTTRSSTLCNDCLDKWKQYCGGCGNKLEEGPGNASLLFNKPWHPNCIKIFHSKELTTPAHLRINQRHQEMLRHCRNISGTFIFHQEADLALDRNKEEKLPSFDGSVDFKNDLSPRSSFTSAGSPRYSGSRGDSVVRSESFFNNNIDVLGERSRRTTVGAEEDVLFEEDEGSHFRSGLKDFTMLVHRLKAMGLVQDRSLMMKSYSLCVIGKDVLDFFVNSNQVSSRSEALILANNMLNTHYFKKVHGSSEMFADDESHFYQVEAHPNKEKSLTHAGSFSEAIIKQGYLTKRGSKVKTWKKRWFLLLNTRDRIELKYYETEKMDKLLGTLILSTYKVLPSDISNRSHRIIKLRSENVENISDRDFYIEADTDVEFIDWSKNLANVCNGGTNRTSSSSKLLPFSLTGIDEEDA